MSVKVQKRAVTAFLAAHGKNRREVCRALLAPPKAQEAAAPALTHLQVNISAAAAAQELLLGYDPRALESRPGKRSKARGSGRGLGEREGFCTAAGETAPSSVVVVAGASGAVELCRGTEREVPDWTRLPAGFVELQKPNKTKTMASYVDNSFRQAVMVNPAERTQQHNCLHFH
ncbi:hypothetical protein MHYP_G00108690 [Metynnis hypsauchen]